MKSLGMRLELCVMKSCVFFLKDETFLCVLFAVRFNERLGKLSSSQLKNQT